MQSGNPDQICCCCCRWSTVENKQTNKQTNKQLSKTFFQDWQLQVSNTSAMWLIGGVLNCRNCYPKLYASNCNCPTTQQQYDRLEGLWTVSSAIQSCMFQVWKICCNLLQHTIAGKSNMLGPIQWRRKCPAPSPALPVVLPALAPAPTYTSLHQKLAPAQALASTSSWTWEHQN